MVAFIHSFIHSFITISFFYRMWGFSVRLYVKPPSPSPSPSLFLPLTQRHAQSLCKYVGLCRLSTLLSQSWPAQPACVFPAPRSGTPWGSLSWSGTTDLPKLACRNRLTLFRDAIGLSSALSALCTASVCVREGGEKEEESKSRWCCQSPESGFRTWAKI